MGKRRAPTVAAKTTATNSAAVLGKAVVVVLLLVLVVLVAVPGDPINAVMLVVRVWCNVSTACVCSVFIVGPWSIFFRVDDRGDPSIEGETSVAVCLTI